MHAEGETPAQDDVRDETHEAVPIPSDDPPATSESPERDLFGNPAPRGSWAHRRAEPRALALVWTILLALATVGAFLSSTSVGGIDIDAFRAAARVLAAFVGFGIGVLWPMVRLSQVVPGVPDDASPSRDGPARACIKDAIVVLAPAQAVLWPQTLIGRYGVEVAACLSCGLAAWAILVAGVLAGLLRPGLRARGRAMLILLVAQAIGPAIAMAISLGPQGDAPRGVQALATLGMMASPGTLGLEVLGPRPWTGRPGAVVSTHWWGVGGVLLLAVIAWLWGLSRSPRSGPVVAGAGAE
ncbi:MAG: hypothetical protein RBS39_06085 [Phycisphaerales bacterium]|jgi:hypothetical protein|nr:hypothetical protein [Phycisphaerales bacterium]